MSNPFVIVLLVSLAAFRLSWMLVKDEGPFAVFGKLRARLNSNAAGTVYGGLKWTLAELFNCPLCLGIWVTLLLALLIVFVHHIIITVLMYWLAAAGLQTLITLPFTGDE